MTEKAGTTPEECNGVCEGCPSAQQCDSDKKDSRPRGSPKG
jgi:hypothetical protein